MIIRQKCGRGFTYKFEDGTVVRGELRATIEELPIPPAWTDVEIADNPKRCQVLAVGRDAAGRKQYLYHPNYRKKQEKAKFDRIVRFAESLETMRRVTGQHLRHKELSQEKVLACMVRLLDIAYFRPGNRHYSKENQTYGLTTLRSRHLTLEGDQLIFRYVGKGGIEQERLVEEPRLAKVVAELDEVPGYEIFQYFDDQGQKHKVDSTLLNRYIKEVMGEDFSAKDFRTWAGTLIAAVALEELGVSPDEVECHTRVRQAVERVAKLLGNTPTVARASYIDPRVIERYLDGQTASFFAQQIERELKKPSNLSLDEIGLLALLRSAPKLKAKSGR